MVLAFDAKGSLLVLQPAAIGLLLRHGFRLYNDAVAEGAASLALCSSGIVFGYFSTIWLGRLEGKRQAKLCLCLFWLSCAMSGCLGAIAQFCSCVGIYYTNTVVLMFGTFLCSWLVGSALPHIFKVTQQADAHLFLPGCVAVLVAEAMGRYSEDSPATQTGVSVFLFVVGLQGSIVDREQIIAVSSAHMDSIPEDNSIASATENYRADKSIASATEHHKARKSSRPNMRSRDPPADSGRSTHGDGTPILKVEAPALRASESSTAPITEPTHHAWVRDSGVEAPTSRAPSNLLAPTDESEHLASARETFVEGPATVDSEILSRPKLESERLDSECEFKVETPAAHVPETLSAPVAKSEDLSGKPDFTAEGLSFGPPETSLTPMVDGSRSVRIAEAKFGIQSNQLNAAAQIFIPSTMPACMTAKLEGRPNCSLPAADVTTAVLSNMAGRSSRTLMRSGARAYVPSVAGEISQPYGTELSWGWDSGYDQSGVEVQNLWTRPDSQLQASMGTEAWSHGWGDFGTSDTAANVKSGPQNGVVPSNMYYQGGDNYVDMGAPW